MVKEFIHIRVWRRKLAEAYSRGIERSCRRECREQPRELYESCVEVCVERRMDEARRLAREIEWYETKLNFIAPRSLRVYDNATGYFIVCYVTRRQRMVCMAWDPSTFLFRFRVNTVHACTHLVAQYCWRRDPSRRLHVESEDCDEVYVDALPPDLIKATEVLMDSFTGATAGVYMCLDCFPGVEGMEDLTYGYSTRSSTVCAYNRCDDRWRICNATTCECREVRVEPSFVVVEAGEEVEEG